MTTTSVRLAALISVSISIGAGFATPCRAAEDYALSLEECIDFALKKNLDLQSGQTVPLIAEYNLRAARSAYEPSLTANFSHRSTTSPGGVDSQTNELFRGTETMRDHYGAGITGRLPTGATYSIGANKTRTDVMNLGGQFFNEHAFVGADIRQPLLKNLWIDSTRLQIEVGRLNLRLSESGLQSLLINVITNVELAYYNLIAARDRLKIFQQSYELASQLVQSHQKQVAAGRMARLDEKQAQARVATSEAALFAGRNQLAERENALKLLISADFASWADHVLVPSTPMDKEAEPKSRESSWAQALTNRTEMIQARLQLEKEHVQLRFAKNQRFPSLDLTASYAYTGSSGEIRHRKTPDYGIGIALTIPLGNGAARARVEAQKLRQRQSLIAYKKLEQQIMADVLDAMNAVESNAQRVKATGEARAFAETALEAEQKKLANGKSTNFIVLQLQADLTQARLNESLAIVDYNRALATLSLTEATTLERHSISLRDPRNTNQ